MATVPASVNGSHRNPNLICPACSNTGFLIAGGQATCKRCHRRFPLMRKAIRPTAPPDPVIRTHQGRPNTRKKSMIRYWPALGCGVMMAGTFLVVSLAVIAAVWLLYNPPTSSPVTAWPVSITPDTPSGLPSNFAATEHWLQTQHQDLVRPSEGGKNKMEWFVRRQRIMQEIEEKLKDKELIWDVPIEEVTAASADLGIIKPGRVRLQNEWYYKEKERTAGPPWLIINYAQVGRPHAWSRNPSWQDNDLLVGASFGSFCSTVEAAQIKDVVRIRGKVTKVGIFERQIDGQLAIELTFTILGKG